MRGEALALGSSEYDRGVAQGGEHGGGWDNGQDTHERGTVALVAGSQFFICFDSLKQLDGYVSEPDHRTLFAHL